MIETHVMDDKAALGRAAARRGAAAIATAIARRGEATVVVATGASQFETLAALVRADVDWSRVTAFHLDEYIGMPDTHPASFRKYLKERFTAHVPALRAFHFVEGDAPDIASELARLDRLIADRSVDVTFAGIGENAHLAFNDPPADFDAAGAYKIVALDERCRRQQFGEGWFTSLDEVPRRAISMTIPQILKSALIVLAVPDQRKAEAVRATLQEPVSPDVPASILRRHAACHLYLDPESAALLGRRPDPTHA